MLPTAASVDLFSPNQLKDFLASSIVQRPCKAHAEVLSARPPSGTVPFDGSRKATDGGFN